MNDLDELQKRLKSIADVVNAFKSESVQLRVVEVLLGQLGVSSSTPTTQSLSPPARAKSRRPTKKTPKASAETKAESKAGEQKRKPSRNASSPGAFTMINQLLTSGFFKNPQTISAIVSHCSTSKGHHYKASECSPGLLRLLRDGKLTRKKNKDGQYEYTKA
ncbi:MAG: hypothetical protein WB870_00455 [Gallionellaceae bacterium]